MYLAWSILLAFGLAWPVPRLLPRWHTLRHVPGPALVLWQAVALGAVIAGLELAPLAVLALLRRGRDLPDPTDHVVLALVAAGLSALIVGRLLARAHVVGRRLRRVRREHRELVDLLGHADPHDADLPTGVRVLSHPTPTAYCVPGLTRRVVLTSGTIEALPPEQLRAVLAHEQAHLRGRHDLILEFFTVWHTAVPRRLRSDEGLRTVRLFIELLADRYAVRAAGRLPVGRALVALAQAQHPTGTLGQ